MRDAKFLNHVLGLEGHSCNCTSFTSEREKENAKIELTEEIDKKRNSDGVGAKASDGNGAGEARLIDLKRERESA